MVLEPLTGRNGQSCPMRHEPEREVGIPRDMSLNEAGFWDHRGMILRLDIERLRAGAAPYRGRTNASSGTSTPACGFQPCP